MHIIKKIFSISWKVAIVLMVVILFSWYKTDKDFKTDWRQLIQSGKKNIVPEKILPEKQAPKTFDFKWEYNKNNYILSETLYGSIYDFYKKEPKEFFYENELPVDWEEKYFGMFLQSFSGDNTIQVIAQDIKNIGEKHKLTDDQVVELVLAFVQTIPYDSEKAEKILGSNETGLISYPYETLYENKGVCSDKTFLAAGLLKELGYGTALFVYDEEKHMALGVQCPVEYSSYGLGYCYAETTAVGNRIGMIPNLDSRNNQAETVKTLSYFDYSQDDKFDVRKLGPVKIYQKTQGKDYTGVVQTMKISKDIENLGWAINDAGRELKALKKELDDDQDKLKELEKKMNKLSKNEDYEDYNKLVPKYNDLASDIEKEIKSYNKKINAYNQKVSSYNSLIKNF